MAEKIQLEVEVKGGESVASASNKVKSLKQQLKEMKAELASGNLGAKEFAALSQKAGELQDRIGDVNNQVKNLASDTKRLDGFINVAQGIAGGFAAAQGAIALFGSENEDLQKTLVKVQGAVALLSGVQAVANVLQKDSAAMTLLNTTRLNILTAAQARYTAVVGTTTGALKALRIVGATLGIGLIVAAIAILISKFKDIKEAVGKFLPSLSAIANGFKAAWNAVTDFIGVTSDATREVDRLREANKKNFQQQENEIELMKAKGATISQLYLAERKLMMDKIADIDLTLKAGKKLSKEEIEARAEAVQSIKVLDATYTKERRAELSKQTEDQKKANDEARRKRIEANNKRQQDEKNAIANELKIAEEREDILGTLTLDRQRYYLQKKLENGLISQAEFTNAMLKSAKEEQTLEMEANDKAFSDLFAQLESEMEAEFEAEQAQTQRLKEENDKRVENERQAYEQRFALASSGLQALGDLTTAFAGKSEQSQRRAFDINKALNISTTLIDTYMSAQKAYASQLSIPTPDAPIRANVAAGVAVASGLARVAAITKTQFGGGGGNYNSGNTTMSNQPNIQGYTTNNIPNQQRGGSGNMRVYVTETDIRNSSRKVDGIYSQATVE